MIEKLSWDSTFFGFPVGKIFVENPAEFNKDQFILAAKDFRLIYVFSVKPFVDNTFVEPVDVKLTFQKELNAFDASIELRFFDEKDHDKKALLELAYESGIYSRFRTDSNFRKDDFFRMYEIWINKSLESNQRFVLVRHVNNELKGFVTVDFTDAKNAAIGLIAVDQASQGLGVGSELMKQAENLAAKFERRFLKVSTQLENVQASAFYKKNGYSLINQEYIYHFWNL